MGHLENYLSLYYFILVNSKLYLDLPFFKKLHIVYLKFLCVITKELADYEKMPDGPQLDVKGFSLKTK